MAKMPEQIAPRVYRVDTVKIPYIVSVLLIRVDDGWALIDAGGSGQRIQQALAALGAKPDELKRIYLTHHYEEHVSGLPAILWCAPHVELMAPECEKQIISGNHEPDPLQDPLSSFIAVRGLPMLPGERIRSVPEGYRFADFRVISTPGHTHGHTSLLNEEHEILLTADAFGRLLEIRVGVNDAICADPIEARDSARKLLEKFTTVVFSHGKPLYENAKRRLYEVVNRYHHKIGNHNRQPLRLRTP